MNTLIRKYLPSCTTGTLTVNDQTYFTMEPIWISNENNISCIPEGIYKCVKYPSKKFGNTFLISEVPEREGILIHCGNIVKDTHGCILIGNGLYTNCNNPYIICSRKAFNRFMKNTPDNFELEIRS